MKKYFSLREISLQLGIPKSTIVKYKDYYSEFLPMAGDGKRKKFEESALKVLGDIRELREDKKLDWMEIKDILASKYGASTAEQTSATQALQSAPAASPHAAALYAQKFEQFEHLVTIIGSEMLKLENSINNIRAASDANASITAKTAKRLDAVERKIDMALGELLTRDKKSALDMKELMLAVRREFDKVNVTVQHLSEETADLSASHPSSAEGMDKLEQKIDKLISEGALSQSKYQVLLRENELLKNKIKELSRNHKEQPEEPRRSGGLFSWRKRG